MRPPDVVPSALALPTWLLSVVVPVVVSFLGTTFLPPDVDEPVEVCVVVLADEAPGDDTDSNSAHEVASVAVKTAMTAGRAARRRSERFCLIVFRCLL